MAIVNDVAVTAVGAPRVAPGMVVVTVSPAWKPVPVTVTVVVAPCTALGAMVVMVGEALTVRQPVQVPAPPTVVTVTLPRPKVAFALTETFTVSCVELTHVVEVTVTLAAEK